MSNAILLLEIFAACMERQELPGAGSPCHVEVVKEINASGLATKKHRLPERGAQAAAVDEMEKALNTILAAEVLPPHLEDLCNDVLEKFEACKVDFKP